MKKKYQITLRTIYGSLTIDDIEAKTENEAIAEKKRKTNWTMLKLMKCTVMSNLIAHN